MESELNKVPICVSLLRPSEPRINRKTRIFRFLIRVFLLIRGSAYGHKGKLFSSRSLISNLQSLRYH